MPTTRPILCILVAGTLCTLKQAPLAAQAVSGPPELKVRAMASVDRARPGDTFRIAVVLELPAGVHVNTHTPSSPDLIPTEVTLKVPAGFQAGAVAYPKGTLLKLSFLPKPIAVYEGRTVFLAPITVAKYVKPGKYTLEGTVRTQPCREDVCFPPQKIPFRLLLPIAPAGSRVRPMHPDLFGKGRTGSTQSSTRSGMSAPGGADAVPAQEVLAPSRAHYPRLTRAVSASEFLRWLEESTAGTVNTGSAGQLGGLLQGGRWLLALPLIYLGGLALNLTPCVYPLIPITIAYFGSQAKGSQGQRVFLAALYTLGMAIMYSALGTLAALTGRLFGSQLQNPYVLVGFAAVMVALGLAMFDMWEFRLPSALTSRVSARAGAAGALVMGLLVGVVAAPCVGPAVVALLEVVGHLGKPLLGFAVFFTLALGLGTPYLVLGSFAGLMEKLPRAGEWMAAVKHLFGLVLFGVALYYLQPVMGARLSALAMSLYTLAAGVYLVFLDAAGRSARAFFLVKRGLGAAAILAAFWMMIPRTASADGIPFEPYSEERVQQALAQGKGVLVDFRADWCTACKEMEATTFRDPRVVAATRHLVALQKDLTHMEDPEAMRLRQEYGIVGLPNVVLIPPPTNKESR